MNIEYINYNSIVAADGSPKVALFCGHSCKKSYSKYQVDIFDWEIHYIRESKADVLPLLEQIKRNGNKNK